MKRIFLYTGIMCGAAVLFSTAYYVSYQKTVENYQKEQTLDRAKDNSADTAVLPPPSLESVEADTTKEAKITGKTSYVLITHDLQNGSYREEELPIPADWIGMNRSALEKYLSDYMKDLPLKEVQEGLISYQLQSFSGEKVVLIKNYDASSMPYEYYITVLDYEVVVYYCDRKTLFEYTGIDARNLSVAEQKLLLDGIFVLDQKELYGILENYSS